MDAVLVDKLGVTGSTPVAPIVTQEPRRWRTELLARRQLTARNRAPGEVFGELRVEGLKLEGAALERREHEGALAPIQVHDLRTEPVGRG